MDERNENFETGRKEKVKKSCPDYNCWASGSNTADYRILAAYGKKIELLAFGQANQSICENMVLIILIL